MPISHKSLEQAAASLSQPFPLADLTFWVGDERRIVSGAAVIQVFASPTRDAIVRRLNEAFGFGGWTAKSDYFPGTNAATSSVRCTLTCATKEGLIEQSAMGPDVQRIGAAGSDTGALTRAASLIGLGSYLYASERWAFVGAEGEFPLPGTKEGRPLLWTRPEGLPLSENDPGLPTLKAALEKGRKAAEDLAAEIAARNQNPKGPSAPKPPPAGAAPLKPSTPQRPPAPTKADAAESKAPTDPTVGGEVQSGTHTAPESQQSATPGDATDPNATTPTTPAREDAKPAPEASPAPTNGDGAQSNAPADSTAGGESPTGTSTTPEPVQESTVPDQQPSAAAEEAQPRAPIASPFKGSDETAPESQSSEQPAPGNAPDSIAQVTTPHAKFAPWKLPDEISLPPGLSPKAVAMRILHQLSPDQHAVLVDVLKSRNLLKEGQALSKVKADTLLALATRPSATRALLEFLHELRTLAPTPAQWASCSKLLVERGMLPEGADAYALPACYAPAAKEALPALTHAAKAA